MTLAHLGDALPLPAEKEHLQVSPWDLHPSHVLGARSWALAATLGEGQ